MLKDLKHLVIPLKQLTILDSSQIGSGGYGEVVLATLGTSSRQPNPRQVAVKQLRTVGTSGTRIRVALVSFMDKNRSTSADHNVQRLARELKIWAKLNHPNILDLLGYYLSKNFEIARLVSPLMINGNIATYITQHQPDMGQRLDLVSAWAGCGNNLAGAHRRYLPQVGDITAGMDYLHGCNPPICHGDLKPVSSPLKYTESTYTHGCGALIG